MDFGSAGLDSASERCAEPNTPQQNSGFERTPASSIRLVGSPTLTDASLTRSASEVCVAAVARV